MYRIVIIIVIVMMMLRGYFRFREGDISVWLFLGALFLWSCALILSIWSELSSFLARLLGIGRGVDFMFLFSILFLVYVNFCLYVRMKKTEHDVTKLIREIALANLEKKSDPLN